MSKFLLTIAFAVVLAFTIPGCRKPSDDVIDQYEVGEEAISLKNPVDLRNTMTPESVSYYQDVIRHALDTKPDECKALPPSMLASVVQLRNRIPAAKLRTMTVDDLFVWYMDNEIWVVDADYGVVPMKAQMRGDEATIQMGIKMSTQRRGGFGRRGLVRGLASAATSTIEPLDGVVLKFKNIAGYWYRDIPGEMPPLDDNIRETAREERMPVHEFLATYEEFEHGTLKKDIWEPLGR